MTGAIDRLPLGWFRHPSARLAEYAFADVAFRRSLSAELNDVAYPGWLPGAVESQPAAVPFAYDVASWHGPAPWLGGSVPAPVGESELR